jgi:hypothetical protein
MTVDDALASGRRGEVRLEGYVVGRTEGLTRLCAELLESYPPQCGGPSVVVEGLDPATLGTVSRSDDVFWSPAPVELSGMLDNGVLRLGGGPT